MASREVENFLQRTENAASLEELMALEEELNTAIYSKMYELKDLRVICRDTQRKIKDISDQKRPGCEDEVSEPFVQFECAEVVEHAGSSDPQPMTVEPANTGTIKKNSKAKKAKAAKAVPKGNKRAKVVDSSEGEESEGDSAPLKSSSVLEAGPSSHEEPHVMRPTYAEMAMREPPPKPANARTAGKVPPVVLFQPDNWGSIAQRLKAKKITFTKAKAVKDGVKLFPTTPADFRALTAMLESEKRAYYTYTLPENKREHAVIKGLLLNSGEDSLEEALKSDGFDDAEVTQMTSSFDKRKLPLYLVLTKYSRIYDVKELLGLEVKVVRQYRRTQPNQCHRCQRHGHGQSRCTLPYRCVKCAGPHSTKECTLAQPPKGDRNAKCANCGDNHTANYKGCPKFPVSTTKTRDTNIGPREGVIRRAPDAPKTKDHSRRAAGKKAAAVTSPENVPDVLSSVVRDSVQAVLRKMAPQIKAQITALVVEALSSEAKV